MELLTPYRVAKHLNTILTAAGLKTIPTQMAYNYVRQGLIPAVDTPDGWRVTLEDATAWAEKYVARKSAKANA